MKKRYLAAAMGLMIAISSIGVYAEEAGSEAVTESVTSGSETADTDEVQETASDNEAASDNETTDEQGSGVDGQEDERLMGRVTEVGEDSLTISVMDLGSARPGGNGSGSDNSEGEMEEEESAEPMPGAEAASEENDADDSGTASEDGSDSGTQEASADAGQPMDATGESVTILITEETQIVRQSGLFGGGQPGAENGEVPEMPDGEIPEMPDGEIPEMPDGEAPEMPDGEASETNGADGEDAEPAALTLAEIEIGDMVMITLDSDGTAAMVTVQTMGGGMAPGGEGGAGSQIEEYEAVETLQEDAVMDGETVDSTGTDENAVLLEADYTAALSNMTISRESSDSTGGDNSSFYGVGAAVLGTDGILYIADSTVTTDAAGGAGIFAYDNARIYVADTEITTLQDTSGGIHAAGGGTLYAWDVTAKTSGTSSAAVRSDRGGGTMVIDGGTYTSNGSDSPAVYCTADISINEAELTSNNAEAVCIEGLNTLRLYNCDLTGNLSDDERNDNTWTVIVYQSMSGDSEIGNGTFQMEGGTLTSGNGGIFYTTNTECTITLKNVEIVSADDCEFFLQCTGNNNTRGWGQSGSNGSDCLFTAVEQEMQGDVIWDSISNLDFYITEGSTLTGAVVKDETYAGEGGDGACSIYIGEDSSWVVTGNSTVTSLFCAGSLVDADGNTVTVQGTDGTVYAEGDSEYIVTAENYSASVDLSGCAETDTWEEHAAERPESL